MWWKTMGIFALSLLLFIQVSLAQGQEDDDSSPSPESDEFVTREDGFDEKKDVVVLTKDNFDKAVEAFPVLLVEFYAPWSGHCKSLAPEYAAAAGELKSHDPPITLAMVDATVHESLGQRFEIGGYPTLIFFKNGGHHPYEGPRNKEGIVEFMKKIADPKWKPPPIAVVALTESNFTEVAEREELMLVEFYAPWCGHCKQFAPIYEKAAKLLQKEDPPIILAKVDASAEYELGKIHEIAGFPTLKLFKHGKSIEYKGQRNNEYDIVSYVMKYRGDGTTKSDSVKDLKKFLLEDDVTVVGFFSSEDDPQVETYKLLVNEMREDYTFGIVYDEATRKVYDFKPGSIVIFQAEKFYTKYEPKYKVFELKEDTKGDDIKSWISKNDLPLVGHYATAATMTKRYEQRRPLAVFFYSVDFGFDHREATQLWRKKIAAIAKDYPDINFAVADEEENSAMLVNFGLGDSSEDINAGLFGADKKRYPMDLMEDYDSDHIKEFLDNYKNGELKPYIKSQMVPKKQGPVTVVVGKTFDKIVLDKSKDVLIEMYAPWCGHCKQLEPIYEKLAKKYKAEKNLVIAKIDATANDLPENFSAEGFPTIYFAPATEDGKKKPLKFDGERDLSGFEKYLKKNAVVSLGKGKKDEL